MVASDTLLIRHISVDKVLVMHPVSKGETLYGISRGYGLTPEELVAHNVQLMERALDITDTLDIPIPRQAIRFESTPEARNAIPLVYRTKPGETVFRIARIYFDMPIDLLVERNAIKRMELSIGQLLHVGWLDVSSLRFQQMKEHTPYLQDSSEVSHSHSIDTLYDLSQLVANQGVAYWNKEYPGSTAYFAMHTTAKINSFIEITNPMFGRSVVAKVVGRIPPKRFSEDISVIVSPKVAQDLGAIDGRFFVKMRFLPAS